ncbi:hypothetical protein PMAC_000398 [Pneumocystis sp. 'macacae']|nr:hypothetical protein PMAC_000398 [Pneumocystis sp. 'macacae']
MFHPQTDHTPRRALPPAQHRSIVHQATRVPPAQPVRAPSPADTCDEPRVAGWGFVDEPTPQRAFTIADTPRREALHHRLADRLKSRARSAALRRVDLRTAVLGAGGRSSLRAELRTPRGRPDGVQTPRAV